MRALPSKRVCRCKQNFFLEFLGWVRIHRSLLVRAFHQKGVHMVDLWPILQSRVISLSNSLAIRAEPCLRSSRSYVSLKNQATSSLPWKVDILMLSECREKLRMRDQNGINALEAQQPQQMSKQSIIASRGIPLCTQ